MTDAERIVWGRIRNRQLGVRFRRQQQIGNYIVDFVCLEKNLVIEIDGGQHNESATDNRRDKWMKREGYLVIRFWNTDVVKNIDGVLLRVQEKLSPSPNPSPQGRGN